MSRRAFTLLEVLACLLVLVLGAFSVLGLILWGQRLAAEAQGKATGWSTALSVLHDTSPPGTTLSVSTAGGDTLHEGWLNGYYVRRRERPGDAVGAYQRWCEVDVTVYRGIDGGEVAGLRRRLLRQVRKP